MSDKTKDGLIKISLSTQSGYSTKVSGKISLSQWEQIMLIIDGGEFSAEPTIKSDNSKVIANLESEVERLRDIITKSGLPIN